VITGIEGTAVTRRRAALRRVLPSRYTALRQRRAPAPAELLLPRRGPV